MLNIRKFSERGVKKLTFISICLITASAILYYFNTTFQKLNDSTESITVEFGAPVRLNIPFIFITDSMEVETDFYEEYVGNKVNDTTITFDLKRKTKLRQFRIYFSDSTEILMINRILLQANHENYNLILNKFNNEKVMMSNHSTNDNESLSFTIKHSTNQTFLESPKFYYPSDYPTLLIGIVVVIVLLLLSFVFINKMEIFNLSSITLAELGVLVFIVSILLPQRIFNIALVLSFILLFRNFNFQHFIKTRVNLFFVLFYALIFLSAFIFYSGGKFKEIEKYLLFLVLPVYVSCIRSNRINGFFCISAFLIGGVLLGWALIDLSIFKNIEIFSFNNFTRGIHPVYYSYLLAFSILYIELHFFKKGKYMIQTVLILLLILSGSKLIIFLTILWFAFQIRKPISFAISTIIIFLLLVFAPTKERFGSILSLNDLSVTTEEQIQNPNDPRLNGFTLRVILWQESLRLESVKEFIFGKGIGVAGSKALQRNLKQRGLTGHLDFNAHNQYVTSMYKTGIIGLVLLISFIFYCIRWGLKMKNQSIVYFTLLMACAMLSESVFERRSGIAFFGLTILLMMNSELVSRKEIDQPKTYL